MWPPESDEDRLLMWAATVDTFATHYPGWTEQDIENTRQSTLDRLPIIWEIRNERRSSGNAKQESIALAYAELDRANAARGR